MKRNERIGFGSLGVLFCVAGLYSIITGEGVGGVATNSHYGGGLMGVFSGLLALGVGVFTIYQVIKIKEKDDH